MKLLAAREKMTVAYTLLRKPFTDELLILEQLLLDKDAFVQKFFHEGQPAVYDPSRLKKQAKQDIEKVVEMLPGNIFYTAEIIYQMRYDKSSAAGLQAKTNHALHIVTTNPNYKTLDQNLNFVFSGKEDQQNYWRNFYFIAPYLLAYTCEVIDAILFPYLEGDDFFLLRTNRQLQRKIALFFWSESVGNRGRKTATGILSVINKGLDCQCPKCEHPVKIERADLQLFMDTGMLLCISCYSPLVTPEVMKVVAEQLQTI